MLSFLMDYHSYYFLLFCLLSFTVCESEWAQAENEHVYDYVENPIVEPTELFEWLVADPTVIVVEDEIHMFANEVFHGILHYKASVNEPTNFTKQSTIIGLPGSVRPYAYLQDKMVYLFYEQYQLPIFQDSQIMMRIGRIHVDNNKQVTFT